MDSQQALTHFIARCDPASPAVGEVYVQRERPVSQRLRAGIVPTPTSRVLLIGQTGVGKTTELVRLAEDLRQEYEVIHPPLDTVLDLGDLGWHEIFVFSVLWFSEVQGRARKGLKPDEQLRLALRPRRTELVDEKETGSSLTRFSSLGPTTERTVRKEVSSGGPPEPTAIQRFRNDYQGVRHTIGLGPAQFWDLASAVVHSIEEQGKPVVFLWDGLEKMPHDAARKLFYEEGRHLRALPCRAVATGPLSLSFDSFFQEIEEHFLFTERLRALGDHVGGEHFPFFLELAKRRGAAKIFRADQLSSLIEWGGGLPRQFVQLMANAAKQALTDGLERVENESLQRALRRTTERWQYQLQPQDHAALRESPESLSVTIRSRLLQLGALLEYDEPDGSFRLAINPLVASLLQRRQVGG